VVKAYAHTIVAPAVDYWKHTIEVKKGAQVDRMKRVRIFNPFHVLDNKISVSDIEGLKIFKLSQHSQILMSSCVSGLRLRSFICFKENKDTTLYIVYPGGA
jgi:hypothetical protein